MFDGDNDGDFWFFMWLFDHPGLSFLGVLILIGVCALLAYVV